MSGAAARLLAPGDLILDWSDARLDPAAVARAGAAAGIRYSAGAATDPRNPSHGANAKKIITDREFARFEQAGLDLLAVDEWYATRAQEGAAAGELDGKAAAAHWRRCGYAEHAAIYSAWDTAPVPALWPAVDAYSARFEHVIREEGGYQFGTYAGSPYLAHRAAKFGAGALWRPMAPAWSNDGLPWRPNTRTARRRRKLVAAALQATPARIVQNGNTWYGLGADENLVIKVPIGTHREALAGRHHQPPPAPHPQPHPRGAHRLVGGAYELTVRSDPKFPSGEILMHHAGELVGRLVLPAAGAARTNAERDGTIW